MDVAAIRAEIKAWEYAFKTKHGRDPTVQDIRDEPATAEKYKLYKKLSKAKQSTATAASSTDHPSRSSTPPLPQSRPLASSILPKPRAVKTETSHFTTNPFSPVKNKGKQRARSPPVSSSLPPLPPQSSRSNPFATPSKDKSYPRLRLPKDPSPEPFPPIHPTQLPTQSSSHQPPVEKTAFARARKRLRGEPVSPSPVKEKKARVTSQSAVQFGRHSTLHDSDASDDGDSLTRKIRDDDADAPFLDDSPVKQPAGSKAYIPLFEEAPLQRDAPRGSLVRSQSKAAVGRTGSVDRAKARAMSPDSDDEEREWVGNGKIKALDLSLNGHTSQNRAAKATAAITLMSKKDDASSNASSSRGPFNKTSLRSQSFNLAPRPPIEHPSKSVQQHKLVEDKPSSLLPPSPPAKDSTKSANPRYIDKQKGKAKAKASVSAATSRKKRKLVDAVQDESEEQDTESPEDEDMGVKVVDWRRQSRKPITGTTHSDPIPDEGWNPTLCRPRADDDIMSATEDPGNFEVSLPDELKRVLAISVDDSKIRDSTEEKMFKELVYGSREMQYDARKGGEIWDVGEEVVVDVGVIGDEDEWEGEPVPWEVGEL